MRGGVINIICSFNRFLYIIRIGHKRILKNYTFRVTLRRVVHEIDLSCTFRK